MKFINKVVAGLVGLVLISHGTSARHVSAEEFTNTKDGTYLIEGSVNSEGGTVPTYNLQLSNGVVMQVDCTARSCTGSGTLKVQKSRQESAITVLEVKRGVVTNSAKEIVSYSIPNEGNITVSYIEGQEVKTVSVERKYTDINCLRALFQKGSAKSFKYEPANSRIVQQQ